MLTKQSMTMGNDRKYCTLQIVLIIAAIVLAGCSTYAVDRYSISSDNVVVWRSFEEKINVGEFTATKPGVTQITCRGVGPIKTPDGNPFEIFIREAFMDEIQIADLYSPSAAITLTGNLDEIDFSSNEGLWKISLTVYSSNGKSISVVEEYSYTTVSAQQSTSIFLA